MFLSSILRHAEVQANAVAMRFSLLECIVLHFESAYASQPYALQRRGLGFVLSNVDVFELRLGGDQSDPQ